VLRQFQELLLHFKRGKERKKDNCWDQRIDGWGVCMREREYDGEKKSSQFFQKFTIFTKVPGFPNSSQFSKRSNFSENKFSFSKFENKK
jgi:hypothetical protein